MSKFLFSNSFIFLWQLGQYIPIKMNSFPSLSSLFFPKTIFKIFLRNNGTKTWAEDSKLINDPSSFLKTDTILILIKKRPKRLFKIEIIFFKKF